MVRPRRRKAASVFFSPRSAFRNPARPPLAWAGRVVRSGHNSPRGTARLLPTQSGHFTAAALRGFSRSSSGTSGHSLQGGCLDAHSQGRVPGYPRPLSRLASTCTVPSRRRESVSDLSPAPRLVTSRVLYIALRLCYCGSAATVRSWIPVPALQEWGSPAWGGVYSAMSGFILV